MEIGLIRYNLKKDSHRNVIVIIIISIILAIGNLNILSVSKSQEGLNISQIFISVFGGVSDGVEFQEQLIVFLQWLFPHLVILYLGNIYISNKLMDDMIIILPRLKSKVKWLFTIQSSIILVIIKYYIIMFVVYVVTSYIFIGQKVFLKNDYGLILSIGILAILMSISLILLLINLNIIFSKNSAISLILLLLIMISSLIKCSNGIFLKNMLINNAMILRHSDFNSNIKNFTLQYSIMYFIIFILLNFMVSFLLVNKSEIRRLKMF
ncbi:hypothetical protein [uncultured Clostridium sp.]|uniref:hypothetical protein n=1 Tax=uncultured Clostridium sp. TaxID=59620 RepID=UPI0028E699B3|nr:hypothetical protein [uncultured Clostridium sp.]